MKIINYNQFVLENFQDTPETYVSTALQQIKRKIDAYFGEESGDTERVETLADAQSKGEKKEKGDKMNFRDLNLRLESSEISKYSKQYDSVTFKFTDAKYFYNLFVMIQLKDAIPEDKEKDFSWKDIEDCYVKFKKYDQDKNNELIGQVTKTIKIKDLDEDKLIELKLELDKDFGEDDEEFEIQTED